MPDRRLQSALCLILATLAVSGCTPAPRAQVDISVHEAGLVDVYRARSFFLLRGRVNGSEPLLLLADTGSETTVIDSAAARRLGLPVRRRGAYRAIGAGGKTIETDGRAILGSLELGPLRATDLPVAIIDLAAISRVLGTRLDGLVGWDVLRTAVVTFETSDGSVRIDRPTDGPNEGRPATPRVPEAAATFEDRGIPVGQVVLPGGRLLPVVIDTGSDGVLAVSQLDPLPLAGPPRTAGMAHALGGMTQVTAARLDGDIRFAGATVRAPVIETTLGLPRVGVGMIEGGVLTIDGPRRRVSLEFPAVR